MKSVRTVLAVCVLLAAVGPLVAAGISPAPKEVRPPTDDSLWTKADSVNIGAPGAGYWYGTKVYGDTIYQVNSTGSNYIIWKLNRLTGAVDTSFASPPGKYAMGIAVVGDSIYVSDFAPANEFDVYTRSGTYVRTFAAPSGRMCRGLDWDGSQFWVADNGTTPPSVYTMDRAGTVLKAFTSTGSLPTYWLMDLAFDRLIPNRFWVNDSSRVACYCSFDTSANTYTVLASFPHPAAPGYNEGIAFWGPELGAGYVYTVGAWGPWAWKMQVHAAQPSKMMFMTADDNLSNGVWEAATMYLDSSHGAFSAVDTYSIETHPSFPAAALYSAGYKAILVYTQWGAADAAQLGDSLAAFIEDGGGVVEAFGADYQGFEIAGRFRSQYAPFTVQDWSNAADTMSLVHDPAHPIMAGVASFGYTGPVGSGNTHSTLRGPNCVCLAEFSVGNRCVVTCFDSSGARAVSIGTYPLGPWYGYAYTGQWVRLFENALVWAASAPTGVQEPKPGTEVSRFQVVGSNPFRGPTLLSYALPGKSRVSLRVYAADGRLVRTLAETDQAPGLHQVVWDGHDDQGRISGHGVYYCRLQAGKLGATAKLVKVE